MLLTGSQCLSQPFPQPGSGRLRAGTDGPGQLCPLLRHPLPNVDHCFEGCLRSLRDRFQTPPRLPRPSRSRHAGERRSLRRRPRPVRRCLVPAPRRHATRPGCGPRLGDTRPAAKVSYNSLDGFKVARACRRARPGPGPGPACAPASAPLQPEAVPSTTSGEFRPTLRSARRNFAYPLSCFYADCRASSRQTWAYCENQQRVKFALDI